ncbi:hypothetical protein FACS189429_4860 [Bacteroidia bacterium]|nr:hypothetical protein FACS189429_4860 [Bacteroidia bacterium]
MLIFLAYYFKKEVKKQRQFSAKILLFLQKQKTVRNIFWHSACKCAECQEIVVAVIEVIIGKNLFMCSG